MGKDSLFQRTMRNLTKKALAFIEVCKAAASLGRAFRTLHRHMESLNESESINDSEDYEIFKAEVDDIDKEFKKFKGLYEKYRNIPSENMDYEEIYIHMEGLKGALTSSHAVLRRHKYSDPAIKALLSKAIGTGQTHHNPSTGQIEQTDKGLVREFFELSEQLMKTINKPPVNTKQDFKETFEYIKTIMKQHGWN